MNWIVLYSGLSSDTSRFIAERVRERENKVEIVKNRRVTSFLLTMPTNLLMLNAWNSFIFIGVEDKHLVFIGHNLSLCFN